MDKYGNMDTDDLEREMEKLSLRVKALEKRERDALKTEALAAIKAVFDGCIYTVHDAPATIKILGELRDQADAYAQSLSEGMEVYDQ